MWKSLELEVHAPINYVALPRRQCYKSVVKGTPVGWPAQQGLLPANGSVYPPNCFLNKPPLGAEADGQSLGRDWKRCEQVVLCEVCTGKLPGRGNTTRVTLNAA